MRAHFRFQIESIPNRNFLFIGIGFQFLVRCAFRIELEAWNGTYAMTSSGPPTPVASFRISVDSVEAIGKHAQSLELHLHRQRLDSIRTCANASLIIIIIV